MKFISGETITTEYTICDIDGVVIDLTAANILEVGATLYRDHHNSKTPMIHYTAPQIDAEGTVTIVIADDETAALRKGPYFLEYHIKIAQANEELYPGGFEKKILNDTLKFTII